MKHIFLLIVSFTLLGACSMQYKVEQSTEVPRVSTPEVSTQGPQNTLGDEKSDTTNVEQNVGTVSETSTADLVIDTESKPLVP